jgi:hypothetical protein
MAVTNALAYKATVLITAVKTFIAQANKFCQVIDGKRKKHLVGQTSSRGGPSRDLFAPCSLAAAAK